MIRLARSAIPLLFAGALCAGEALGATHVVTIEGMKFVPATLRVGDGDTIEWRNEDVVPHTATSQEGGFDVVLAPQEVKSIRVEVSRSYDVDCRFHPTMRMRIERLEAPR